MNITQANAAITALKTQLTPIEPIYPPLVPAPDGSSAKVVLCYLLKGIAYLADLTICETISDPTQRDLCIGSAHSAYLSSLSDCEPV